MTSWVVTGSTRGIGFGFIDHVSSDPANMVFALIRSRKTAGPLEELATKRKNIYILETDISDPAKLDRTAAEISKVTGGSLDVLILNAASAGPETNVLPPSAFQGRINELNNEINANIHAILTSNIYVILALLDLLRNGREKKVIHISSNSGDVEFNRITAIPSVLGYGTAKAGMNLAMSKFAADLSPQGFKFLSIAPGWVATDAAEQVTGDPEIRRWILGAFHKLDPTVTGPVSVDESVGSQLKVIQGLTVEDSGKYVGRFGDNTNWF